MVIQKQWIGECSGCRIEFKVKVIKGQGQFDKRLRHGINSKTHSYVKDLYSCPIVIFKGLIDKGQFQYLTGLKGSQEGTYLYPTHFLSLR